MVNGRALGVAQNGVFNDANTDPIPGGLLWTEAALTWNAMRTAYIAGGGTPAHFVPGGSISSARSFADQRKLKAEWTAKGQPEKAATPGKSNHGWGIAVDTPHSDVQVWIMRNGGQYGWSHDEGARVGEAWHFRYVGASKATLAKFKRDPFAGYMPTERRWVREYDRLVRTHRDPDRREVLRRVMATQRKRIWRLSQPRSNGGDGKGWTRLRTRRYESLLTRTN